MSSERLNKDYPGTILVTGASGGIGFEIAKSLLEKGFKDLVLVYRTNSSKLRELCMEFGLDPELSLFRADLTIESEVNSLHDWFFKNHSKIWALLNVAGGSTNGMLWKLGMEDFNKVISMNLGSTFLMMKTFSNSMRNQGFGRIINFSSVVAQGGIMGASHYCAAKAGIEGLTRSAALELVKKGVLVNAIALGYFEYGLIRDVPEAVLKAIIETIPSGRLGKISDLSPALEYLMDPTQNYVTGQVIHVSGGLRI